MPKMKFLDLWHAMQHDKKVINGAIHCVLPQRIGEVCVVPLVRESMRKWFSVQQRAAAKIENAVRTSPSRPRPAKKK
jgi:3-dehydroquinate synthetase